MCTHLNRLTEAILKNTHNIPLPIQKKKITLNLQLRQFFLGTQEEFETAVVNEPLVFEPLKFYCICSVFMLKGCNTMALWRKRKKCFIIIIKSHKPRATRGVEIGGCFALVAGG